MAVNALVSLLAACGETPETGEPQRQAETPAASMEDEGSMVLANPFAVDPCGTLTQERADAILGRSTVKRPGAGGACVYAASTGETGLVRLLLVPYSFEVLDSRAQSPQTMAATFAEAAGLEEPPDYHGDISGRSAFAVQRDNTSVLFIPSGVMTTATVSDRVTGEMIIQISLTSDEPHELRLEKLAELAEAAIEDLRQEATEG